MTPDAKHLSRPEWLRNGGKDKIAQWIMLIIALTTISVVTDRRLTTLEVIVARQQTMLDTIVTSQEMIARTNERLTVLVQKIEERHQQEDRRRR